LIFLLRVQEGFKIFTVEVRVIGVTMYIISERGNYSNTIPEE